MGNSLASKKTAKVMKIDGETFKLKTPVQAEEVLKEYPRHVLLDSEAVKHFGIGAKPLQPHQHLGPKSLYFLIETANLPKERAPRRVRSSIHMSAMERLESLKLSRRSVSDLSTMKPRETPNEADYGKVRIKLKLPRAQVEKVVKESGSEAEAARKIMDLCVTVNQDHGPGTGLFLQKQMRKKGSVMGGLKAREKKVSFMTASGGGSEIIVAS